MRLSKKNILNNIKILLLLNLFFCSFSSYAELKDSLKIDDYFNKLNRIQPKNVDSILQVVNDANKDFKSSNNEFALYKIKGQAAFLLSKYGYYHLSISYYLEALKHSEKLSDLTYNVKVLNAIGAYYGRKGDFNKAETYLLKASLLANKIGDHKGLASSFLKLGALRTSQQKPKESLMFYEKIDSLNKHHQTNYYQNESLTNKGILYAMDGRLDSALRIFKISYKNAVAQNEFVDQVLAFQNIGLIYKEKGELAAALKSFNEGINLAEKHGLKENKIKVAVNVPLILIKQNKKDEAYKYAVNLLAEAEKIDLQGAQVELYEQLIEISKMQGNFKGAVEHLEKLSALKSKFNKEEGNKSLAEAAAELDLYKTQRAMKSTVDLLFETKKERNTILAGLITLIFLLAAVVFFLIKIKKLNQRLNKNKTQLIASNNNKNKLFSIIGHDLRSAYSSTLGVLGLMKSGDLDKEEQDKYLDIVMNQSESALATLDDLLLWGHAQIKGTKLTTKKINAQASTDKNIHFYHESLAVKNIKVFNQIKPDDAVYIDENHFSFIIRNLIANAIKYTPNNGKITITASLYKANFTKICVKDSGIGIPEEKLETIFLADSKSTRGTNNEKGTGLGLTLCKEFAEANGGEIWAENVENGGAKICFTCKNN